MTKHVLEEIIKDIDRVFLSEMDFQFYFIQKLALKYPNAKIIPEYPYARKKRPYDQIKKLDNQYLDIFIKIDEVRYGIELKYKTKAQEIQVGNYYKGVLKNQGAHPLCRYYYLWDINRLEYMIEHKLIDKGFNIILSNDKRIWSKPGREHVVDIDVRFKDYDGSLKTIPKDINLVFNNKPDMTPKFKIKGKYTVPEMEFDVPEANIKYFYSLNEIKF